MSIFNLSARLGFSFFCFLLVMVSLSSCGPDDLFIEKNTLEGKSWVQSDSLSYSFEVQDTSKLYNIYVLTDFENSYPFQNLYVRLRTTFPNGKSSERVRSLDLFDAAGNRLGDCSGDQCEARIFLQENAFFNLPGTYTIELIQHARRDTLAGIRAMGLEVERTEKVRE